MANYTISIEDMLEMNKQPGESLDNLSDLCAISKRALFNKCDLSVIDSDFVDRFCTQFAIHYLDHEICCPSEFKWRIYLAGHVMENAELINSIFTELEKQIFSDYDTKTVTSTINETVHDDGTIENDGTVTSVKTGDDTIKNTGTSANAKTGTETGAHTGTDTQVKSGDDTLKRTGQSSDAHTGVNTSRNLGDDNLSKVGTETTNKGYNSHTGKTGSILHEKTGSEINEHDTTDTTRNFGKIEVEGGEKGYETTDGNTSDMNNTGDYTLDTPMDELQNLRSTKTTPAAAYDATGKGISAAADSSMKYMSSATLHDGTTIGTNYQRVDKDMSQSKTTTTDTTGNTVDRDGSDTLRFNNRIDTESYNNYQESKGGSDTDTLSFTNRADNRHVDTTKTDTFNESNTKTDNLQDKTEYNSTTQDTRNLTDTTTYNTSDTRTDNLQSKTEYNTEDTRTDDLTTTKHNTNVKTGTNVVTEVSNKLNWELLMRCEAPMNKIWRAFDEIFWPLW